VNDDGVAHLSYVDQLKVRTSLVISATFEAMVSGLCEHTNVLGIFAASLKLGSIIRFWKHLFLSNTTVWIVERTIQLWKSQPRLRF
jgi:hypothetical protein